MTGAVPSVNLRFRYTGRVQPPDFDVPAYVGAALAITAEEIATLPILLALAHAHTLFESIHPFHDGNGRVGRILLNYLAISQGYPPIVIKGMQDSERERYYSALEAADSGFHTGFPAPSSAALRERLNTGGFTLLCQILYEGLMPRLDRLIALALEQHEPLLDLRAVADRMDIKEGTLRLRIHRGRHIAIKRGKKLYSHPRLAL